MRTILICHEGASLNQVGLARWLASFSDLVGLVVLRETNRRKWRRIRREIKRVGLLRFFDVMAFRIYYKLVLARRDRTWQEKYLENLCAKYPESPTSTPILFTPSPNTLAAEKFIRQGKPNIMVARCKTLLQEKIFSIPTHGTVVMHPGICPEYRNAHGCFWALANDDLEKVGMTLLRIDKGVDTGPVYGYYSYPYDELAESPILIQHRVVFENLDRLQVKLREIYENRADSIDTTRRASNVWGHPWLTQYFRWKWNARNGRRKKK